MSIASLTETHRLLQHDEAHHDKWATNDHDCSPDHYAKKKKKPHASYTARTRAAQRAIYIYIYYESSIAKLRLVLFI